RGFVKAPFAEKARFVTVKVAIDIGVNLGEGASYGPEADVVELAGEVQVFEGWGYTRGKGKGERIRVNRVCVDLRSVEHSIQIEGLCCAVVNDGKMIPASCDEAGSGEEVIDSGGVFGAKSKFGGGRTADDGKIVSFAEKDHVGFVEGCDVDPGFDGEL